MLKILWITAYTYRWDSKSFYFSIIFGKFLLKDAYIYLLFTVFLFPTVMPSDAIVLAVNTESQLPLVFDFSSVPSSMFCQTLSYVNTGISELEQGFANFFWYSAR